MRYEREIRDESGARYSKNHRATVCVNSFDFGVADFICQLLQYKYCQQWGRAGDTNRERDLAQR